MDKKLTGDIQTVSGYNTGGISRIWLLDADSFASYRFEENDSDCRLKVCAVVASSSFIELGAVTNGVFEEDRADNMFRQKLSAFIEPLSADILGKLLIASGNKYLVLFRTAQGQFFTFASDGGATLSFTQQTGDGSAPCGYTVSIVKNSACPLFEATDVREPFIPYTCRPVFSSNPFCLLRNGKQTGYRLANYAVKETKDGQAIDINGRLCSRTGRKQAIYLLKGTTNPNSNNYEIAGEYSSDAKEIGGVSIVVRDIEQCTPYYANSISATSRQLIFENESSISVTLTSLHQWQLVAPSNIATCLPTEGKAGRTTLVFNKTDIEGIFDFRFRNLITQQTVTLNVINQENAEWVLKNGAWNENGLWLLSGIWE
ncbi:MAG: hypothetical protein LBR34_05915 [Prevotella sp.]|jgi:hypothetical protein|nr:hypothetical protein [Prevotella sp.]